MRRRTLAASLFFLVLFFFVGISQGAESRLEAKGRVIDEDTGKAIQGVLIEIENASGGSGYSRARSDETGMFGFDDLPSGVSFNLYGEKEGYTSFRRLYWYVETGKEKEFITLKLRKEAVLKCRLKLSDNVTPVERARVTLKPMGWREGQFSVYEFERETGDNGVVTINRIPTGTYELIVEKAGYIRERLINISLLAGKTREMTVTLFRPASLSGRLLLKGDKTPLAGIPIIARGPGAGSATSNFNGVYSLRDLKPGTYGFTATKSGFRPYQSQTGIIVKEGEDIRGVDHFLTAEEEKVKIAVYQEVYPLKKEITFAVRAFRSEDFGLSFHHIPMQWYLKNPQAFHDLLLGETPLDRFKKVYNEQFGFERYRPYTWFTKKIKIAQPFEPGIYLVRATTSGAEDRNFIFVSNIGVVVKRGKGSLLAYALNFGTNQPEKGVDIFLLRGSPPGEVKKAKEKNLFKWILGLFTNNHILLKGKTDAKGIFRVERGITGSDILVAGLKQGQGIGVSESYRSSAEVFEGLKFYLYTDRPVYRPGHRVFFKGIVRVDEGKELRLKPLQDVEIELKDSGGRTVATLEKTTDDKGCLNGSFDLLPEAGHGRYTLWVKGPKARSVGHFFVQAYRKPDFKIDLATDKSAYVSDDTVTCRIHAAYFFGSPLANASVTYRIYQKMARRPHYRYWWEGEYYRTDGYQSLIRSGTSRTDAQGFVSVAFVPSPKSYDRTIIIEAEVAAPSGRKVSAKKTVLYNQSLYQIEITHLPCVHRLDRPLDMEVEIRDINGKPVQAAFTLSLEQEVWNPIRSRYEKPMMPLYTGAFETDAGGVARLGIPSGDLTPGYTRLLIAAVDPRGERVVRSAHLWLYDGLSSDFNYNYAGLELRLDREDYREGDTARLLVNSPVKKGTILFTMEGQSIIEHRVISMGARTLVIEIPVKKDYAPNVFLSVLQNEGNRLYHKKVSLNVAVEGKEIRIETAFDKKEYRPGEAAELNIRALDAAGKPVQGDFSVGVVDEAVYYIRPDHTVPIHSYFYAKRAPWVSTSYSFPIRYLGGAVKSRGSQSIRKDFRDTAFWVPDIATDQAGRATVRIPFPDNLTTWVATVRGHSAGNLFGEKREKALVTKPLITSLKPPRFFVEGDRTEVRAVNVNRTDDPLEEVRSLLEVAAPVFLLDSPEKTVQIPKQGTGQLTWRVLINKGRGETPIRVHTRAGVFGDGEECTVKVLDRGLPRVYHFSGRTVNNRARIEIPVPGEHALPVTSLELETTPHPALAGLTSLDYLASFPYGCVEQTLNSFVPLVCYSIALKDLGLSPDHLARVEGKIGSGLRKLEGFQASDGGFGWWKDSERDLYLTSLVLLGLSKVRETDPEQVGKIMKRAATYIRKQIRRTALRDLLAFGLYALSEAGYRDDVLVKTLKSGAGQMDALTLSLSTLALANHGMTEAARSCAEKLTRMLVNDRNGAYFQEPESYGHRLSVETTAYGLLALLRTFPDRPVINAVLDWLVLQKTGRYWISTKTTGVVISALSEYIRLKKDTISFADQTVSVSVNGRDVPDVRVSRLGILKGKGLVASLPSEDIVRGKNVVEIKAEKDLSYALKLETFLEADPIPPGISGCHLPLTKKVYAVNRVHDSRGNSRIMSRPLEKGERLSVGQEIRVEVRFTPGRDYRYFILEDGLPSGFEVVDFEKDSGTSWWSPCTHKERRDEKVVFFFDRLDKGRELRVEYILRSELNGDFYLPPARLYGMYRPDISSNSGSGKLIVGNPGR